jgi:mono/diheme cytochrome c family protein
MKQKTKTCAKILVLACIAGTVAYWILFPATGALAADGLFSAEQAKQGMAVYSAKCAACHGQDLDGGEHAPPIGGDAFWANWDKETARKLYSRILTSMPPDNAGSLEEKDVIRIVTYLMQQNGLVAGGKEIESANQLNSIKLERPK